MGKEEKPERDEVALAARASTRKVDGLTRALPAWLEPIKKKLIEARKAGATLEELREQMLAWHPNTQALAEALAENVEAGLRGSSDEDVRASAGKTDSEDAGHEIGCNQYADQPGCAAWNKYQTNEKPLSTKKRKKRVRKSRMMRNIAKDKIFPIGDFDELKKLGVKSDIKINGEGIRKGITNKRWTFNNSVARLRSMLNDTTYMRTGFNHKHPEKAVVEVYSVLVTESNTYYNKIIIDCETGLVDSVHDIGKVLFEKITKKRPVDTR